MATVKRNKNQCHCKWYKPSLCVCVFVCVCVCVFVSMSLLTFDRSVSGYDFEEYTFPCCGKTFFINNSCEFDEYKTKKNVSSEKCVVDSKNGNG